VARNYAVVTADWDQNQIFVDLVRAGSRKAALDAVTDIRGEACALVDGGLSPLVLTAEELRRLAGQVDKLTKKDSDQYLKELGRALLD
jgi:hypothetical protein